MLIATTFSWKLVLINALIYAALQFIRMIIDCFMPRSWYDHRRPYFQCKVWEREGQFYQEYFNIKGWKDCLPSIGGFTRFSKRKLKTTDPAYLERFINETCRGESHHVRSILETSLFILWNPLPLFMIIFSASALFHLPYIMIQRYNRPRLMQLKRLISDSGSEEIKTAYRHLAAG